MRKMACVARQTFVAGILERFHATHLLMSHSKLERFHATHVADKQTMAVPERAAHLPYQSPRIHEKTNLFLWILKRRVCKTKIPPNNSLQTLQSLSRAFSQNLFYFSDNYMRSSTTMSMNLSSNMI
jgi:hypothetical protein